MLNKTDPAAASKDAAADKKEPVVIKKYANRRLYNTDTSTYVTLDDLAAMVKSGRDFVVFDAKTGDDLTHSVLTQIIVEQESRMGTQTLLPIPFLRQLITVLRGQRRTPGAELPADHPRHPDQRAGPLPQDLCWRLYAGWRLRGLSGAGAQEPGDVRTGDGDVLPIREQVACRQAGDEAKGAKPEALPTPVAKPDEINELKTQLATMQAKLEQLSRDRS